MKKRKNWFKHGTMCVPAEQNKKKKESNVFGLAAVLVLFVNAHLNENIKNLVHGIHIQSFFNRQA